MSLVLLVRPESEEAIKEYLSSCQKDFRTNKPFRTGFPVG